MGAWTDHFLLEKSRLVHVDPDERNYHVFYEMLRGLSTEELEVGGVLGGGRVCGSDGVWPWVWICVCRCLRRVLALHIHTTPNPNTKQQELKLTGEPEDYAILAQGGCCALEDVDDAEEFGHVCEALATLGLRCVLFVVCSRYVCVWPVGWSMLFIKSKPKQTCHPFSFGHAPSTHATDSEEEIRSLWRLLAVLLHLGNLEYDWDETEGDPVTLSSTQVNAYRHDERRLNPTTTTPCAPSIH